MEGCHRKEAWTGGKPNCSWTRPEHPCAINFLQPIQMQSCSAKATTSHLKRTEVIFLKEACGFKTGEHLDDPCTRPKTHFKKHGMDTIPHRNNPNNTTKMVPVFNSCPLFIIKSIKTHNIDLIGDCNTCDKQNNDDAIKCFVAVWEKTSDKEFESNAKTTCSSPTHS